MRKKLFRSILFVLIGLVACCSCVSCKDETASSGGETGDTSVTRVSYQGVHEINATETDNYLVRNGKTDYVVVISASASKMISQVKTDFIILFKKATGISLSFKYDDAVGEFDEKAHYISIGETALVAQAGIDKSEYSPASIKTEGVRLITKGDSVFILGGSDQGVCNAVYKFLEIYFNYDYYYRNCIEIDTNVTDCKFKKLDVKDVPDVNSYYGSQDVYEYDKSIHPLDAEGLGADTAADEIAAKNLRAGQFIHPNYLFLPIHESLDITSKSAAIHNVMYYIPRTDENANMFSAGAQLCYTAHGNAEDLERMLDICTEKIVFSLKNYTPEDYPYRNFVTFTMTDNSDICNCAACKADYAEVGYAGNLIKFASKLGQRVDAWLEAQKDENAEFHYAYRENFKIIIYGYNIYTDPPVDENGEPLSDEVICYKNIGVQHVSSRGVSAHADVYDEKWPTAIKQIEGWKTITQKSDCLWFWHNSGNVVNNIYFSDGFTTYSNNFFEAMAYGGYDMVYAAHFLQGGGEMTAWQNCLSYVSSKLRWDCHIETDEVVYNVNVNVYGLVVQSKEDLGLFALKFLRSDNPLTAGVDETKATCIDGYCVLLNDIDATGVTIAHEVFDVTYEYVNSQNQKVQASISMSRYNSSVQKNAETGNYDNPDGLDAFGFIGRFDGQGYTISNLDTSVEAGKTGGGLFGYLFGNAIVENVGFANLNISNSSGLAYSSFIPVPRPSGKDIKGLRTNNTEFKDIYIELSADTVNPKGALINRSYSTSMGLVRFENIIIDATALNLSNATAAGIITHNAEMLRAENNELRFYSRNVYVIGETPAYFDTNVSVYGINEASGNETDTVLGNSVYSTKFKRYDTFEAMANAENDYGSFVSSSWVVIDRPVFKTASGVYAYYLGEAVLDGTVKVNSAETGKSLSLATLSGETVAVEEYVYDDSLLSVDENGNIRLAQTVDEITEYELTLRYNYRGRDGELTLKVLASPAVLEVDTAIEMSAYSGAFELSEYVELPKNIVSATQDIGGRSYALTVDASGNIKGATVAIASDRSDVLTSELTVTTLDMTYKFTNVKIYSHIIDKAEDLQVLKHTQATGRITGYYVLGGSINAGGAGVAHDESLYSSSSFDNAHAFQGVFDGRGYAIYNFRPSVGGLLGSVYSDAAENGGRSVIRNVGFVNVLSEKGKDFTIFGKFIESAGTNLTEVENVHVEIANTYLSDYNPTSNYKGLFHTNSSTELNTFKFTNVYVTIENEEYTDTVALAHGSLLSRDNVGVGSKADLTTRSARFDNVITVTKMNPCIYRQFVGDSLTQTFDTSHMYFVYAANDAGKQGLRCNWLAEGAQYCHDPIAENGAIGSYLYNNVFRYDTASEVADENLQKLLNSGLWLIKDGSLQWRSAASFVQITDPEMNFDVEWLEPTV